MEDGTTEVRSLNLLSMKVSGPVEELEGALEELAETLRVVGVLLEEPRPENASRLVSLVSSLSGPLDRAAAAAATPQVRELSVPRQVFEFLDSGTNPDLLTRQLLEKSLVESEICKGKVVALADYHQLLQEEAVKAFPELSNVIGVVDEDRQEKKIKLEKI